MKTQNASSKIGLLLINLCALLLVACNNGGSSGGGGGAAPVNYQLINGQCLANGVTPVAMTFCQNANGGYTMNNGQCYAPNGQIVQMQLCQQNQYCTQQYPNNCQQYGQQYPYGQGYQQYPYGQGGYQQYPYGHQYGGGYGYQYGYGRQCYTQANGQVVCY